MGGTTPTRESAGRPVRPRHNYVFVVTYGRSGSTLAQGMLNALPRTLVRGENGFFIWHLYQAARDAGRFREQYQRPRTRLATSAFFGIQHLTARRFARAANQLMTSLLIGSDAAADFDRIGFKEVRWHLVEPEETEAFFAWLDEVFPGAKYVLNTRDVDQVVGSGYWQQWDADERTAAIQRAIDIQDHLRKTRPDRVYENRYEIITGDDHDASDAALRGLAEFVVGSCDDALLETLRETLKVGHGPGPFGKSRTNQQA